MTVPQWNSPFDILLNESLAATPETAKPVIGSPESDAGAWDGPQSYQDTCAIRCQEFILEQFTGREIPEDALIQQAMNNGWYSPGFGTMQQDVGKLLEANGVSVTCYDDANIFHLSNELAQGHKVIVGVDSGELWKENPILESIGDALGISGADHAVVVSGIDTSDPDNVQVIVSDPGTGAVAARYPMDQFVDAWRDSGGFMVATQEPAPPHVPEMVGFNYDLGHLDRVWGLPYDAFMALIDDPAAWDAALDHALMARGHVSWPDDDAQDAGLLGQGADDRVWAEEPNHNNTSDDSGSDFDDQDMA